MRILLIDPHLIGVKNPIADIVSGILPALGILSVAAVLRREGHDVAVLDCQFHDQKSADAEIGRFNPDVVGISTITPRIGLALSLAHLAKRHGAIVILGGPHTAVSQAECLSSEDVDLVIIGEAEETMPEVCMAIERNGSLAAVRGLCFRSQGRLVRTQPRPFISDLNRLPMCAWDLVPLEKYMVPSISRRRGRGSISLVTSRGCVWNCSFCSQSTMFGHQHRTRRAELVLDEMTYLYHVHGKSNFRFYDEIFTYDKSRVEQICHALIAENMDFEWCCQTRVDLIDRDLLRLMKRAGCHTISVGVESGSQPVLDKMNKDITPDLVRRGIGLIKGAGIQVQAFIMMGFPGETESQVLETMRFAASLPVDYMTLNYYYPRLGTAIYDEAMRKGRMLGRTGYIPLGRMPSLNYISHTLSEEFLKSAYHKAYRQIYWHPKRVAKYLFLLRSGDEFMKALYGTWKLLRGKR